jgi:hypothetical protein
MLITYPGVAAISYLVGRGLLVKIPSIEPRLQSWDARGGGDVTLRLRKEGWRGKGRDMCSFHPGRR